MKKLKLVALFIVALVLCYPKSLVDTVYEIFTVWHGWGVAIAKRNWLKDK